MIDWQFREIGHRETGCEIPGVEQTMKCGQYCEDCGRFIGRWMSWGNEKVWCEECWGKRSVLCGART